MYLSSIAALPDQALIERVERLVRRERQTTAALVAHLAEMEARRLHLKEGYSSLFAYCTEALHLSEQAAYNRIEAARAAKRFPRILARLADGSLHLTAIRLLAPILTEQNHEALLQEARHRSRRDVEEIVARIRPSPPVPSSVRRLPEPRLSEPHPPPSQRAASFLPAPSAHPAANPEAIAEIHATPAAGLDFTVVPASTAPVAAALGSAAHSRSVVTPLAPGRYRVQFTASGEMHARLRRAQALLRHQVPDGDIAAIFDLALQALIQRVEARKLARPMRPGKGRAEPNGRADGSADPRRPRIESTERTRPGEPAPVQPSRSPSKHPRPRSHDRRPALRMKQGGRSRYIAATVRRAVWERDGGRCAYVSPGGRRCTETSGLEFHHLEPHACGGEATIENIQLRCRGHNRYEAEVQFGAERVQARAHSARGSLAILASTTCFTGGTPQLNARQSSENRCNSSRDELRTDSQGRRKSIEGWTGPPEEPE